MLVFSGFSVFIISVLVVWLVVRDLTFTFKISYYEEVLKLNGLEDKVKGKSFFELMRS